MALSPKSEKIRFFDDLYAIHGMMDGNPDEDRYEPSSLDISLTTAQCREPTQTGKPSKQVTGASSNINSSQNELKKKRPLTTETVISHKPIASKHEQKSENRKQSLVLPNSLRLKPNVGTASRRKSRVQSVSTSQVMVLKSNLFSAMFFYFIPNDTKNATRRIKIKRFDEHGAFCLNEWLPDVVTHIIADCKYKYSDILNELKIDSIPGHIIVVKDTFPSDCLRHRRIVDHAQFIYQVPGRTPSIALETPLWPHTHSLKIKAREGFVQETPIRISQTPSHSEVVAKGGNVIPILNGNNIQDRKDELDSIIKDSKEMPFIDHDDPGPSPRNSEDFDSSENEAHTQCMKRRRLSKSFTTQDSSAEYQFMTDRGDLSKETNPNRRTIEVLSEMEEYYSRMRDEWRSISYRKAIATLRTQSSKIQFSSEAVKLPNIGPRLAQKIEEIAQTDQLQRLQFAKLEPNEAILKLFLGVYGAGLKHAQKWVSAGYKTLQDLIDKTQLSPSQRIGVEHHADFNTRIPRNEVLRHGEIVIEMAKRLDKELELHIMGSYRRGAKDCGDIDIMITKKYAEQKEMRGVFDELVKRLTASGFLKCSLAIPRNHDDGSKWHGASALSNTSAWRRIDFLIVPWAERGAALLYFTGNDIFNRSLRLLASKKGYRLNQRGLYKIMARNPLLQRITEGTLVEGESEEKIFEILGVPYRPPHDRSY